MKTKLTFALAMMSVLDITLFAQGSLTPPGPPTNTMKTLDQLDAKLETRAPISSAPFTITNSGSYYLTAKLTVPSGNAINIAASGVTVDLNGFTITSTSPSPSGYAIQLGGGNRNITILNGFIESGVTNNGLDVYSGSGFVAGVYPSGNVNYNVRVTGVSVRGCFYGIILANGDSTIVESCTVHTVSMDGITADTIRNCVVFDCGGIAISGEQVSSCRGASTKAGNGIEAVTVHNSTGTSGSGRGVSANHLAINSLGVSFSGTGLFAFTAMNCHGTSYGLGAIGTGIGLVSTNASFCTGARYGDGSGTAIQAIIATGCIAVSGTNKIGTKYNMP
jgi:hypothetical protein